jgi:hypothetical protein
MTITDDSISGSGNIRNTIEVSEEERTLSSVTITFFNRDKKQLPKVYCVGDIIRCHRVLVDVSIYHALQVVESALFF